MSDPRTFVRADGRFDMDVLLREFASFWVEQGDTLAERATYAESGAQLVMMAFLQRVVNGGGVVTREYGIGRRRIDLLIQWPYADADGKRQVQRNCPGWRDAVRETMRTEGVDAVFLGQFSGMREAETRDLTARYDVLIQTYRLRHAAGDSLITTQVEVSE